MTYSWNNADISNSNAKLKDIFRDLIIPENRIRLESGSALNRSSNSDIETRDVNDAAAVAVAAAAALVLLLLQRVGVLSEQCVIVGSEVSTEFGYDKRLVTAVATANTLSILPPKDQRLKNERVNDVYCLILYLFAGESSDRMSASVRTCLSSTFL
uniref:PEROXIDASE_4 domain-containing protein n=1 Tax=Syphacia muris TaxID=451379 RepID=A0A0N5A8I4_9BILA